MPWQAEYHAEARMIEIVYEGRLTPEELVEAFQRAVSLGRDHGADRFLADCTNLQGGHSIVDLYGLADLLAALRLAAFKEAVLLPHLAASQEDVAFWETTCRNRGLDVRVFAERTPALTWLCASAEA